MPVTISFSRTCRSVEIILTKVFLVIKRETEPDLPLSSVLIFSNKNFEILLLHFYNRRQCLTRLAFSRRNALLKLLQLLLRDASQSHWGVLFVFRRVNAGTQILYCQNPYCFPTGKFHCVCVNISFHDVIICKSDLLSSHRRDFTWKL